MHPLAATVLRGLCISLLKAEPQGKELPCLSFLVAPYLDLPGRMPGQMASGWPRLPACCA